MSQTYSTTETYSFTDIELVMRRVTADLVMIAASTGAVTEAKARDWGHDIEVLAKNGYLHMVDLTLLSNGAEQKAIRFIVNPLSGELTTSRPGGVLWPKVLNPDLRILLFHTAKYDAMSKERLKSKLKLSWFPSSIDASHSTLKANGNRDYVSNGYGMQRRDYSL